MTGRDLNELRGIAVLCEGIREPIDHVLKTWPDAFREIREGHKRHEFRRNDRGFKTRDLVLLREFSPIPGSYSGEMELVRILSISVGPEWGIPEGFACFSIDRVYAVKISLPLEQ